MNKHQLIPMVDAAMVEMKNITPPLKRSECERLIAAALGAHPAKPFHGRVERHSDQSVLVAFGSCHEASVFERSLLAAPAQPAAAPQGVAYAELTHEQVSRIVDVVVERSISLTQDASGIHVRYDPNILADAMGAVLRASHGQAPAHPTWPTDGDDAWRVHCPFCGSENTGRTFHKGSQVIECQNCLARGPQSDDTNAAKSAWATRAPQAAQQAPAALLDTTQRLHNLLYTAQRTTGEAQHKAINAARVELSKVRAAAAHPPSTGVLRALWIAHGGTFHGPNVETGTMPEAKLMTFLQSLAAPTAPAETGELIEYIGNGMFKGEAIQKAAEHWANWCDRRMLTGLAEFLRVVAARAPADSVPALLAADHKGMRVDYSGLLGQCQRALRSREPANAEMLRQLQGHIQELGQRWYAGNTSAVDEFLQLYCVEHEARQALKGGA